MYAIFKVLGEFIYSFAVGAILVGAGWMIHSAYIANNPLRCFGF